MSEENKLDENDELLFANENPQEIENIKLKDCKLLIVDDDEEVHQVTKMILKNFSLEGRKIVFIHAYSGEETKKILLENPDTAIILLDVVMETDDAGLNVIKYIRNELKNNFVRIIVRTGQPGKAPEEKIILDYDINDYKEKTELTANKLLTTIISAWRAYNDLVSLDVNRMGLERIIKASSSIFEIYVLKVFANEILLNFISILTLTNKDDVIQGFSASLINGEYVILSGTDKYLSYVEKKLSDIKEDENINDIKEVIKQGKSQYLNNKYIGYFKSKNKFENILFLEGIEELTELDENLIKLYCTNVSIGFDNLYLNQELENSNNKIKTLQVYLSNIIESMPSLIISLDNKGHITQWNKACYLFTGIDAINAIGKPLWDIFPFFYKYKDDYFDSINSNCKKEFFKEKFSNGNIKFINITIFPLSSIQEKGGVFRIDDVTELEKTEEQLRQAQKMEIVGTLAGGLAHDFNNVLGGILGTISLIKFKYQKNNKIEKDEFLEFFNIMENASKRAAGMVQQLLALSSRQELSLIEVNLNFSIKNVIKLCQNSFDKSVEFVPEYSKEEPMVLADSGQMEQIMLNLCINAYHAMTIMRTDQNQWGGKITISLRKIHSDEYFIITHPNAKEIDYWVISVNDTGVGIDEAAKEKIFEPFFTTKTKGIGTGLGLSIINNIVNNHNGFIDLYSEKGIGTTFNVYIPSYKKANIKDSGEEYDDVCMGEGLILVVDDELIMRKTAKEILKECGYDVLTAENGENGIVLLQKNIDEVKLVVLDMIMPGLSTKDTYILMKKIKPNVKILLTSGFKNEERINDIINIGAKGFIQKPFSMTDLSKTVSEIILGE
ncbi:MAG: hypothetical protein A2Y34_13250 [Spirochaetes bacterium GWC1_27_15]|nr:MAG: hypothetical protein A2Y34_13250 [Spirochaetes bacterium GWC1_27_15]